MCHKPVANFVAGFSLAFVLQIKMNFAHLFTALHRRARLIFLRARFPRANFGAGSDIRAGFKLRLTPDAKFRTGAGCILDTDTTIECSGQLTIGERVIFGHHCTIGCKEWIEIGDDCLLAEMISIRDHDHNFESLIVPIRAQGATCAPVKIGRDVWLGAKVTVLKGVTIGDGAIIGANAVVTRDIPSMAIAVGIPARVIRMRDEAAKATEDTEDAQRNTERKKEL